MRKIIYVPLMHSSAETGTSIKTVERNLLPYFQPEMNDGLLYIDLFASGDTQLKNELKGKMDSKLRECAVKHIQTLDDIADDFSEAIEDKVKSLDLDYENLTVYHDGFIYGMDTVASDYVEYMGMDEDSALEKSRKEITKHLRRRPELKKNNLNFLAKLLDRGVYFKKTEDRKLTYESIRGLKSGAITMEQADAYGDLRDQDVAKRINDDHKEGEAMLLMGASHKVLDYIDSDFEVLEIKQPFDAESRIKKTQKEMALYSKSVARKVVRKFLRDKNIPTID